MGSPFLGEICMFGCNFAPRGWAFCSGQLLSISQNSALFALVGTIYGGDGQSTFALPDLRGRVPVGQFQGPGLPSVVLGEMSGELNHTLISAEIPAHSHTVTLQLNASGSPGTSSSPAGNFPAVQPAGYSGYASTSGATMSGTAAQVTVGAAGGSQAHNNRMPSLGINYCIALEGIFPSRN